MPKKKVSKSIYDTVTDRLKDAVEEVAKSGAELVKPKKTTRVLKQTRDRQTKTTITGKTVKKKSKR